MSSSPPFKTSDCQGRFKVREVSWCLTEVGERVLEFVHEFYEVGIHSWWWWLKPILCRGEGGKKKGGGRYLVKWCGWPSGVGLLL